MREIKFRGKSKNSGKWLYGSLLTGFFFGKDGASEAIILDANVLNDEFDYDCYEHIGEVADTYEVEPDTVGQFTGLYDKNDKEIYEGDIVHKKHTFTSPMDGRTKVHIDTNYVIEFNDGVYYDTKEINTKKNRPFPLYYSVNEIEVIGNIHQNKELLKGNKE